MFETGLVSLLNIPSCQIGQARLGFGTVSFSNVVIKCDTGDFI